MEHGRKKREKVPLSAEKQKEQEELTAKIGQQIQEFFSYRQDVSKLTDALEYTSVMAKICPEIQTIYNLRKEIIQKKLEGMTLPEKHAFLINELQSLIPLMKQNPKSYCLWHHRRWCFVKGLEIEQQDPSINKILAKQELGLCELQLAKDERNFHVWNYRSWLINILKTYDTKYLDKELQFIDSKLQSNFSNFSALHFKSKNLLSKYSMWLQGNRDKKPSGLEDSNLLKDVLLYGLPLETIKQELETVKTGLYMQSGEQSMWLYHQWLIDRIVPIKIKYAKAHSQADHKLVINLLLSQKVKGLSQKNIHISTSTNHEDRVTNFTVEHLGTSTFTNAYRLHINLNAQTNKLVFHLVNPDEIIKENSEATIGEIFGYSATTFLEKRLVSDSLFVLEWSGEKNSYSTQEGSQSSGKELSAMIDEQKKVVLEILELEPDNRFAHSQLIYIILNNEEPLASTHEALEKREQLNKEIIKSSENLLKKNPGLTNRFAYFLKLYQLKSHILQSLSQGDVKKVQELEQNGEFRCINLGEVADLLLLSGVKVTNNEVSSLLKLFE